MGLFSKKPEPIRLDIYTLSQEDCETFAGFPNGSTWREVGTALDAIGTEVEPRQDILEAIHGHLAGDETQTQIIPVFLQQQDKHMRVILYENTVGYVPTDKAPTMIKRSDKGVVPAMGYIRRFDDGRYGVHFFVLDKYLR